MDEFENLGKKEKTIEDKKEELLDKIDYESAHSLVMLKGEIENDDYKKSPEAEEITNIMDELRGKVKTQYLDNGCSDRNFLSYVEEKFLDADTAVRINAVKSRSREFMDKYGEINSFAKKGVEKIYEEKTRDTIDKFKQDMEKQIDTVTQSVSKKITDRFGSVNADIFLKLSAELKSKVLSVDSNFSYDSLKTIEKEMELTMEKLKDNFVERTDRHDTELKRIYDDNTHMIAEQSIEDLDLKTKEEKERDARKKALEDMFK